MSSGLEQKCCLPDITIWVTRMRIWFVFPETNLSSTSRQSHVPRKAHTQSNVSVAQTNSVIEILYSLTTRISYCAAHSIQASRLPLIDPHCGILILTAISNAHTECVCVCVHAKEREGGKQNAHKYSQHKRVCPQGHRISIRRSKSDYCIPLFAKLCIKESLRERGRVKVLGVLYRLVNGCY